MKRILILLMALAVAMAAPAKSKTSSKSRSSSSGKTAVVAYTLAGCSDCVNFKRFMKKSGVKLVTTYTRDNTVSLYPTVVYSDGAYDNGERLYGRQVRMPKSLKIIETD